MENRKELSEKSKKLIAKQFKSDILNKSTGYYKKENIYPITSKPNELKIKLKEFVPHFQEVKAVERHFNNLLSDKQRNNSFIIKHKKIIQNKNEELEIKRKRAKTIRDNCFDKKGNFSCKKRYIFEFYGIDNLNNTFDYNNNININTIKNNEEEKNNKEKEIKDYTHNSNINKESINKSRKYKNKLKEKFLKSRNIEINREENFCIKPSYYEEKYNTMNNNIDLNNSFFNDNNKELFYNKITRNKNQINDDDIMQNTFTNTNAYNYKKMFNRMRTDIHYPGMYLNNTVNDIYKKQKNFFHARDLSNIFYTKNECPIPNPRIKKQFLENKDKEHFVLEFKSKDSQENLNQKNIKEMTGSKTLEECLNIINKNNNINININNYDYKFRTKSIRSDFKINNLSYSLSCTDKIMIRNILGFQGKFLSFLFEPIYLNSIIINTSLLNTQENIDKFKNCVDYNFRKNIKSDNDINIPEIYFVMHKDNSDINDEKKNDKNSLPFSAYWYFPNNLKKVDPSNGIKTGGNIKEDDKIDFLRVKICNYDLGENIINFLINNKDKAFFGKLISKIEKYILKNKKIDDFYDLILPLIDEEYNNNKNNILEQNQEVKSFIGKKRKILKID